MYMYGKKEEGPQVKTGTIIWVVLASIIFIVFLMVGGKYYTVWSKEMSGKAQLAEAEWSKQIAIEESKAKKESAIFEAQAEIERAKGIAEANRIVADGLKGNEEYLRYLWIDKIQQGNQVIYIPTEAGLPILEAGKRQDSLGQ